MTRNYPCRPRQEKPDTAAKKAITGIHVTCAKGVLPSIVTTLTTEYLIISPFVQFYKLVGGL